jgi:hypothetical protein
MAAGPDGGSHLSPPGELYFTLLRNSELQAMRPLLQAIHDDYQEVLAELYRLYAYHFGSRKALNERKFVELITPAIKESVQYLLEGKLERYAARARTLGEAFAEQGVPFDEIVLSLHLYEESVATVFPSLWENCAKAFGKLSHIRIVLLTDSYVRWHRAATRIGELESEAAQLPTQARTTFHGMVGASPVMRQLRENRGCRTVTLFRQPALIAHVTAPWRGSLRIHVPHSAHACWSLSSKRKPTTSASTSRQP